MAKRILVQQTSAGEPVQVGEMHVYPVARSYRIDFPGGKGGMAWNKPFAVIVEDSHGKRQIIPVHDRTRRIQVAILTAGLIASILTWAIFGRSK
jgi:hypothetical protein